MLQLYLLYKYNHWVSCPDDHSIFWSNYGPNYHFSLLYFFSFGGLGCCNTGLSGGVLVRWGEGYKLCLIEDIDDDRY